MERSKTRTLSLLFSLCVCAVGFGHGGSYRGPGDLVPPNIGGPGGDVTPPSGPGTGGGHTGPGPMGPGGGSTGGAGQPTPNPGRGRSGSTGGVQRRTATTGFDQWEFWWEHNKEPFLALKERIARGASLSGTASFLIGNGRMNASLSANRASAADVRDVILPTVRGLLGEPEAELVDSAVLALARMVRAEDADSCMSEILAVLHHDARTAREAAALALGVLGSDAALPALLALVQDSEEGRRLCHRPEGVEERVRAFAAASLGMIGSTRSIDALMGVLEDPRLSSQRELQQMAVLALGRLSEEHDRIATFLVGLLRDRRLDRFVRAQAPIALGKLNQFSLEASGRPSSAVRDTLTELVTLFQDDKSDLELQRSLANALAMIADLDDPQAVEALIQAVESSRDSQTRHFSLIALGRIAARDDAVAEHLAMHARIESFLVQEMCRSSKVGHLPWAALALGVYGRGPSVDPSGLPQRAGAKILEQLEKEKNPSFQGALAISLGLLGQETARPTLTDIFQSSRNQPLKGYVALSLGLLRADLSEVFRTELGVAGLEIKYRLQLARALGVMGDPHAVGHLLASLESSNTLSESTAMAQALGLVGDRSAIQPLVAMIGDQHRQPLQRGLACVALGLMAEKTDLPWNTSFAVDSNYRAKTEALAEILDIL